MVSDGIKNIIFDYGNVIFTINFSIAQQAWQKLGIINAAAFFGHGQQHELFNKFDKGGITAAQFRDGIRLKAGNPKLTDDEIDNAWNSMLIGIPEGNHHVLLQLKNKYRTFLLSNINEIHYNHIIAYLRREFDFDGNGHLFEKVYYSHHVGKRKPDADIFEQVISENDLDVNETLFVDDSPQHLATAAKLGLHTFLMKEPDNLQLFIKREGFL
jgi:FMN phosphatase YigB (HAD superfamily)